MDGLIIRDQDEYTCTWRDEATDKDLTGLETESRSYQRKSWPEQAKELAGQRQRRTGYVLAMQDYMNIEKPASF